MTELEPVAYQVRAEQWGAELAYPQAAEQMKKRLEKALCRQVITEPLVTLSSAQSAIAERDARIEELEEALDEKEIASGLTSGGNLWRYWAGKAKDLALKNADLIREREAAEALLKEAGKVLEPFAKAADIKLCGEWRDDERFAQTDVGHHLYFGHLRAARSLASKIGGKNA